MTTIVVDRRMCMGHARCNSVAPNLFPLDDDGFVEVDEVEVPVDGGAAAHAGAAACPERAIRLV